MKTIHNTKIIGIDHGYGNMKTANCCFPTGITAYDHEPLFTADMLVYGGRYYLIGEGHKEFAPDKIKDEDYYVLTLAAIAKELKAENLTEAHIVIAAGLPLTWTSGQKADFKAYLMKNAVVRLGEARHAAAMSGMLEKPLIGLGGSMWCLFPWLGTYAFLALERFLKLRCAARLGLSALDSSRPYFLQFKMKASEAEFFRILTEAAEEPLDPMELLYPGEIPLFEKYDEFLPPELVRKGFACGVLGIAEMKQRIRSWNTRITGMPPERG